MFEGLILTAMVFFVVCYIPQLYTLFKQRKHEGYNPWFQLIEFMGGVLMLIAIVGLNKGPLLVLNYILCSSLAAACCVGWWRAKYGSIFSNSKRRKKDKNAPVRGPELQYVDELPVRPSNQKSTSSWLYLQMQLAERHGAWFL